MKVVAEPVLLSVPRLLDDLWKGRVFAALHCRLEFRNDGRAGHVAVSFTALGERIQPFLSLRGSKDVFCLSRLDVEHAEVDACASLLANGRLKLLPPLGDQEIRVLPRRTGRTLCPR